MTRPSVTTISILVFGVVMAIVQVVRVALNRP